MPLSKNNQLLIVCGFFLLVIGATFLIIVVTKPEVQPVPPVQEKSGDNVP